MIALADSTTARQAASSAFLTIGQAASRFAVSVQSLRRWANSGRLPVYVTPGGTHRRFKLADVQSLMGLPSEAEQESGHEGNGNNESSATPKVALLARVSTNKQGSGFDTAEGQHKDGGKESDLERQVGRLREVARVEYGVSGPEVFADIGSGVNMARKNFLRLIDLALEGKLRGTTVLCTYKDRLARFGGSFVEHILEKCGAKVVYLNKEEVSDTADLASDLIAITTHFSAKVAGAKARATCTLNLTQEGLERARELRDTGYSVEQAVRILNAEGFTCQSEGKRKPRLITVWVLTRVYASEAVKVLDKSMPVTLPEDEKETSVERFIAERVTFKPGEWEAKMKLREFYAAYAEWCGQRTETPCTLYAVGLALRGRVKKTETGGVRILRGLAWKA